MKKRIISAVLCILIVGMCMIPAGADHIDTTHEETLATTLKHLGLFKGVSDTDFDLGREPKRTEAIVMLIRLLGKEEEALSTDWEHPFIDVPPWASRYVGYAYNKKLTNGISDTMFGTGKASSAMYLTFVLRSLGYSDINNEDFSWKDPFALSSSVGILSDNVDISLFWRADVVLVSYYALLAYMKGTDITLAEKLISAGVFSKSDFEKYYSRPMPEHTVIKPENYHGHVYTGGDSSTKYHYEAECAGKYSHEITWDYVNSYGLTPCGKCVLK